MEVERSHRVLLVDDEERLLDSLVDFLELEGFELKACESGEDALEVLASGWSPHVSLVDVMLPGRNGIELLTAIQEKCPTPVVIMTGQKSMDIVVSALRAGASDFLTKPFDPEILPNVLQNAIDRFRWKIENTLLREEVSSRWPVDRIVGSSPAMVQIVSLIHQVASTDAPVLITGESGTGKELVARALHETGSRRDGPFVAVNCPAISPELFEDEFFGHEKGAFTGAQGQRDGRIEASHGGTLFLDEIGCLPVSMQVKLLRVLQEGTFERVGGEVSRRVDLRVVAATNAPLEEMKQAGEFREDLYYRLSVFPIHLPPLRERKEDIPALTEHFLEYFGLELGKRCRGFTNEVMDRLMQYDWPGNVRELAGIVERALILARPGYFIDRVELAQDDSGASAVLPPEPASKDDLKTFLERSEKVYFQHLLRECNQRMGVAASRAGLPVRTLRRRLRRLGM